MTTILALNAVASLFAAVGIGGLLVRKSRQARRRQALLQIVYATAPAPQRALPRS